MPKKFLGLLVGGILLISSAPAGAATVEVRVEDGGPAALVAGTVNTTPAPVSGDAGAHSCSGDTAAGALHTATAGDWAGTWFSFGDYQVARIKGTDYTTAISAPYFWTLAVNEQTTSAGICGT